MERWKLPLIQAMVLAAVVVFAGPFIRSPFGQAAPDPSPAVNPTPPKPGNPAPPASQQLGPITMEVLPGNRVLTAGQAGEFHLAIRLTAKDLGKVDRPPLNLALVLDKSGSMQSQGKLGYARQAARTLVDMLGPQDRLALVVYDSDVEVLSASGPVKDRARLHALIDQIMPGGSTNLSGGFIKGAEEVVRHLAPDQINRVLLMTDGLANNGIQKPRLLNRLASDWYEKGVGLSTFGLGNDFNEDLLQGLAETAAGQYHFIETPEQMASIYAGELKDLMKTAARGAVLRLRPAPGVSIEEVYGYKVTREDGTLFVPVGDLYGGQTRKVVARLKAKASPEGTLEFADFELSYRDMENDAPRKLALAGIVEVSSDQALVDKGRDREVLEMVESTQVASVMSTALSKLKAGKRREAKQMLLNQIQVSQQKNETDLKSKTLGLQLGQYEQFVSEMDEISDARRSAGVKRQHQEAYKATR